MFNKLITEIIYILEDLRFKSLWSDLEVNSDWIATVCFFFLIYLIPNIIGTGTYIFKKIPWIQDPDADPLLFLAL